MHRMDWYTYTNMSVTATHLNKGIFTSFGHCYETMVSEIHRHGDETQRAPTDVPTNNINCIYKVT